MKDGSQPQMGRPLSEELSKETRRKILLTIAFGTFMAPLDSSVVNIALPEISKYFQAPLATVEWVVIAYLLMISSLLLSFGRLGDIFGHKKIYLAGFAVFTLGSLLCGSASSIVMLIISRAVQAIGAGMLMAMGPAIVTDVTPPQERGKALGIIAISVSVALAAGPVLGGILTHKFGWPSIFYINLPIGILAIIAAHKIIPDTKGHQDQVFDIKGAIIFFLALTAILTPLTFVEKFGWQNSYVLSSLVTGIGLLIFFVILEKRTEHPMVDMNLFKNRLFSMANLSALLSYISLFSVILVMPFYLQQLRHLPASSAGLLMIPMPLTTMVVAPLAGAISDRFDTRYISALGMGISSIGMVLLSNLEASTSFEYIIFAMIVVGLGSAMFQTPNNSAIMGAVPPHRRGIASGLLANMRNMGMVLGVAISGAVFTGNQKYLFNKFTEQGLSIAAVKIQAFTGALYVTFLVAAAISALAIFTSLVRGPMEKKPG